MNLKYLRKLKGLTQSQLALDLGISRAKISAYESNISEPSLSLLSEIAVYFKMRIHDLLIDNLSDQRFYQPESAKLITPLNESFESCLSTTVQANKIYDSFIEYNQLTKQENNRYIQLLRLILDDNWALIAELSSKKSSSPT